MWVPLYRKIPEESTWCTVRNTAQCVSLPPQLSADMSGMIEKLKDLEDLKLAAAKDSMGDAAAGRPMYIHMYMYHVMYEGIHIVVLCTAIVMLRCTWAQ